MRRLKGGKTTNFENVTKTPEAPAEESVYVAYDEYGDGAEWMSVFVNGTWRTWEEAVAATPEWRKAGKLETATGYGNKLHTPYMLDYEGRRRRLYRRRFGNVGVTYIIVRGEEVIVDIEE